MKNLAVITVGENTAAAFSAQLRQLLGNRVHIDCYCLAEGIPRRLRADIALFSSEESCRRVRPYLDAAIEVVVARRAINYHEIGKLFAIPPGTDVLLVNDLISSTEETIALLQTLGITHINYHPYSPQMQTHAVCPVAVTPGEAQLAPEFVREVIDIKTRRIDITTLVEVLIKLELLDAYANFLSANYVKDMVTLIRRGAETVRESEKVQRGFRTVLHTVHDGIVATDEAGRVSVFNPVAEQLFQIRAETVVGRMKAQVDDAALRALLNGPRGAGETLLAIKQRQVVVNIADLHPDRADLGRVYTLRDVSEIRRLEEAVRRRLIHEQKLARYQLSHMVGESPAIRRVIEAARRMADSDSTILIQGESGTGKEIIAQGIHNASKRRLGPFVAVNFAALTEGLLESELFGYVEGAFTGASRGGAPGLFEEAHKGTIFLDEIGDAPPAFQVKLLRVLQERQVRRVGSAKNIPIDVRVIAATNCDMKRLMETGAFRRDLYYRLNVLPIAMPPLRERGEDILLLAETFYRSEPGFAAALPPGAYFGRVAPLLLRYAWPGNIRELRNVVEYLTNVCPDSAPEPELLPAEMRGQPGGGDGFADESRALKARIYREVLAANQYRFSIGRRSLAERLGVPESRVRVLLEEMRAEGSIVLRRGRSGLRAARPEIAPEEAKRNCGDFAEY